MSHAKAETLRPAPGVSPDQSLQSSSVQQQEPKSQTSARSALYANGGARERAARADLDRTNGNPKSRSRLYGRSGDPLASRASFQPVEADSMIIVRVELLSASTGWTTELARMHICNEGGTATRGDYGAYALRGCNTETLDKSWHNESYVHTGKVKNHARLSEHVWNLVGKALHSMGYKHD